MTSVEIERLTLDVPGLSDEQGRRLGEMVAHRFSQVRWMEAQPVDTLDIVVAPGKETNLDRLANLILAELQRRLA